MTLTAPLANTDWTGLYARRAAGFQPSEIREFTKLMDRPGLILLAGGVPDATQFPLDELRAAYAEVLASPDVSRRAFQYAQSEGHAPLRAWIAGYMRARGVACDEENVLIVNGSQQGLDLLGKLFLDPGDTVGVAAPTYLGALQAFTTYQPRFATFSTGGGFRIDSEAVPKFLYAMSDFQNPSGETLPLAERMALVDWAQARGVPVLEDNAYAELRYVGEPIPSLMACALGGRPVDQGNAFYLGSFSKSVVPGLRIGWLVAPRDVVAKLVIAKQASDLQASTINQVVLHRFLERDFAAWSQRLRREYGRRRDAMLAAVARHLPEGFRHSRPDGGYFVWVEGPADLDAHALLAEAIEQAGVAFVPGRAFHADGSGRNTFRLSFSTAQPDEIEEGVRRLGALLRTRMTS